MCPKSVCGSALSSTCNQMVMAKTLINLRGKRSVIVYVIPLTNHVNKNKPVNDKKRRKSKRKKKNERHPFSLMCFHLPSFCSRTIGDILCRIIGTLSLCAHSDGTISLMGFMQVTLARNAWLTPLVAESRAASHDVKFVQNER